jgi:F-type H+-transporting ATPase subunit gamma
MEMFLAGECHEVYELHAEFMNVAVQKPLLSRLLPFSTADISAQAEEDEGIEGAMARKDQAMEYICEPDPEVLMIELLPKNIEVQVYGAILEAVASEHAARMTAMDNAQSNCKEMIENLTLAFNKARQAAITTELMDIVGGAEALKKG